MLRKSILLVVFCSLLTFVGFRLYEELVPAASSAPAADSGQRPVMLVETAQAGPHVFDSRLEILGELIPLASVEVMSRVSGRVSEILVDRGDPVRKGQLLVVVDDEDIQQQIRRAEASIAVSRAAVKRDKATYDNLAIQSERYRDLHAESLVSTQDLQDIESRVRVAAAQVQLVQAQVDQAEASLRELKLQQEQTRVYSPLDGFVGIRALDPGALVNPSVSILRVLDLSRLKTVVPVTEGSLREVLVGLTADVNVDAFPGSKYSGRVTRISPFFNPETRTADIEIEIANSNGNLRPGMFARVTIASGAPVQSLAIPRSALLTKGDEKGVYLLTEEATTRYRPIEIGRIQGDIVEVLAGLQEGVTVVTSGAQKLNDGDKVRIG